MKFFIKNHHASDFILNIAEKFNDAMAVLKKAAIKKRARHLRALD